MRPAPGQTAARTPVDRGAPLLAGVLTAVVLVSSGCSPDIGTAAGQVPASPAPSTAGAPAPVNTDSSGARMPEQPNPYVGLWVTEDGNIRQRLQADGRYVEARGTDESAYTGRYEITGDHIEYWDDSGFTADGDFRDDVLYHGGMVMRRADG